MWRVFGAATHTHTQVVTTCRSPIPTATVGFALQFPPAGGIDFRAKEVSCWILVAPSKRYLIHLFALQSYDEPKQKSAFTLVLSRPKEP